MKKNNEKGFSLIELLVVVIIIAIVAAIAIPNLIASRKAANEASAIASMRSIHTAQTTYFSTTGLNVNYANGIDTLAGFLDSSLTGAAPSTKSGYTFNTVATTAQVYCATAAPVGGATSTTGLNGFAVSQFGQIYKGTTAGTAPTCAAGTGVITNGTAIQ